MRQRRDSWDNQSAVVCFLEYRVRVSGAVRLLCASIVLSAFAAGCSDSPTAPSTDAYSQTDLRVGTGTEALATSTVTVFYSGWFYDAANADKKGVEFDSNVGGVKFIVTLGAGSVIQGWDKGIPGMRVGGQRRLVIPPSLGFGANRYGSIPPNTTVVFDIELVDVQ
jgi:FKBP-type peptidyl-prolyl cis-trans isomerase